MSIAPYRQCIAVSTTNNPSGTYFRYVVTFDPVSPSGFNDYGKLGIWNDGYYIGYNMFGGSPAGNGTGAGLCVSDRVLMLAGNAGATTLCAPITFYGGGASLFPADIDGTSPPTDTTRGGLFLRQSTAPALRYLRLLPDFVGGTVTLTDGFGGAAGSFVELPLPTTTRACNGAAGACIAQPGTATLLDTLADRLMYRVAYRNRGGVDSLVVTQSVDPDGAGARSSAIRWYEIRNPLGNPADPNPALRPVIFQNGTFDPGAAGDRWMGSVAMNGNGDMMVGYSLVNAGTGLKASIAVAGRQQADPLNTLQAEQIALTGTGSQTITGGGNPLTRWGDYTTMQVDPSDDRTFWYIGQYLAADGAFNWRTRIVSYAFPTGLPTPTPTATPTPTPTPPPGSCSANFDNVTAPALPAGWTSVTTVGALPPWVTSTTSPDTAPNDAFAQDIPTASNTELISPPFQIAPGGSQMTFRNLFNMQAAALSNPEGIPDVVAPESKPASSSDKKDEGLLTRISNFFFGSQPPTVERQEVSGSNIVPITEDAAQAEMKRQVISVRGGKAQVSEPAARNVPNVATAIRPLAGCTTNTLPANDDGSTGAVALPFTINYFGTTYTQTFVNNNGNITFTGPLGAYTPFPLTTTNIPIIAPFFADVDTRGPLSGLTQYGNTTVNTRTAFCANWVNVGYFASHDNLLNSFQLLLIDRTDTGAGNFDIEFNYNQIVWETGDASGGVGGQGGSSARAGYANGTTIAGTFYEFPGSAVNGGLEDSNSSTGLTNNSLNSSGVLGRYTFNARNGVIPTPTPTPTPLPGQGLDGMVLEISINGGAYQDIVAAGGSFVTGGYTHTISSCCGSPIAGRMAWSGLSAGTTAAPAYITTTVNLPAAANGQSVRFKWRDATDNSGVAAGTAGVRIDSITGIACAAPTLATVDGRALTSDGRGLRNATVSMTDLQGVSRTTTTSSFGFFSFNNVSTGQAYTFRISSRFFRFSPRTVQVNGNLTLADFVGLE